jgi:flagellar biosynthetic protein FliQ
MTAESSLDFVKQALLVAMEVGAPLMLAALVVGLVISLLQAVTQIHEVSLTFVPKIAAVALTAYLTGSWMLEQLMKFTRQAFAWMPHLGG